MTAVNPEDSGRFRLLASFIAGRSIDIVEAPPGHAAYTNGAFIFVSASGSASQQRREMLVQGALLGAGSLDHRLVRALRARPSLARRYLTLEGHRSLFALAERVPLAANLCPAGEPRTAHADESLELAGSRAVIPDPPEWFGVIKPSRLLTASAEASTAATDQQLRMQLDPIDSADADDGDEQFGESKILRLFEAPIGSRTLADYLRKLLGGSRSPGDGTGGAEMPVGARRRVPEVEANARPVPTPIRFTDDGNPGAAVGVGGALYPEWDVHNHRYRSRWCRVIDFPLTDPAEVSAAGVSHDDVLRRRLSRLTLGLKVQRRRPDGDELDVEALIDLFVDVRSGYSAREHVYLQSHKLARDLGVLILLDASGSGTDTDPDGLAVHDHQRRAAAVLAHTLEELGDRVAVYAFRSHGRQAVHLPAIKTFEQRFSAVGRARLNQIQPSGYTRLGAGIRGAGDILKTQAGTPNRLLVVLSDGYPYDDGYEGRYAEADTRKAVTELRADGVACLCLSIGAARGARDLERVFGSASFAGASTLAELSPQMDELFLSSLRELATPQPRRTV